MGIFKYPNIDLDLDLFYIRIYFINISFGGPITFQDGGSGYQTNKRPFCARSRILKSTKRGKIYSSVEILKSIDLDLGGI